MSQRGPTRDRGTSGFSESGYQDHNFEVNLHEGLLRGSIVDSNKTSNRNDRRQKPKHRSDDSSLINVASIDDMSMTRSYDGSKADFTPQRSQTPRIEALDAIKSMAGMIDDGSSPNSHVIPATQRALSHLKELFEECNALEGVFLNFDGFNELLDDHLNLRSTFSQNERYEVFNSIAHRNKKYKMNVVTFSDFNAEMNWVYHHFYSGLNVNSGKKKPLPMETPKPEFNDNDIYTLVQRAIKRKFEV